MGRGGVGWGTARLNIQRKLAFTWQLVWHKSNGLGSQDLASIMVLLPVSWEVQFPHL